MRVKNRPSPFRQGSRLVVALDWWRETGEMGAGLGKGFGVR